jgi:hypothetical protein
MITFYIACLLLLGIGAGLAYFGAKHFGLSLALSYGLPNLLILLVLAMNPDISSFVLGNIDPLGMYTLLAVLVGTAAIYFFSKWMMYCYTWLILFITLANLTNAIVELGGITLIANLVISTGLVYYFRIHLKRVVIGLVSGLTIAMGLILLIFKSALFAGEFDGLMTKTSVVMVVCLAGGIAFQYLYMLKKQPEEIEA